MKDRAKAIGGKVVRGAKAVKQNGPKAGKARRLISFRITTGIGVALSKDFFAGSQLQSIGQWTRLLHLR